MRKISLFAGVAAALALLISQPLAGTAATLPKVGLPTVSTPVASSPAVTTPPVTVPSVTVPSLTTPRVTTPVGPTPTVSTPSVTTPSATTPKVATPVVKTPSVTTPSVTAPPVTAPPVTAPPVTTPLVKAPHLPGTSPSSPSSPSSTSSSPASPSGASGSSAATTSTPSSPMEGQRAGSTTAGSGPGAAAPAHSVAPPSSSGGAHRNGHGEAVSRHSRQALERAENRRLRAVVERYQGCLNSLDGRSQRLLSLRAGLHGSPRSARAVARILHISAGREQLLERMSLLALQTAGGGGCGGSTTATTVSLSGPSQLTSTAPWVTASSATSVLTGSDSRSATGSAASQRQPRAAGGPSAAPVVITPAATRTAEQASTGQHAMSWAEIILLSLLVMAVSVVFTPGVRRRLLPAVARLQATEGSVGRAGAPVASLTGDSAPRPEPTESAQPTEPADNRESPASKQPEPQPQPETPTSNDHPQPDSRSTWMREHATQGALVATVLAGGLVRILKRGRGR